MTYTNILAKFLQMFPHYQEKIREYTPDGADGIKVRCHDGQKLSFVYHAEGDWILINHTQRRV